MNTIPILSILTVIPLAGGGAALLASGQSKTSRSIAFGASLLSLAVAAAAWAMFDSGRGGAQYVERLAWAPSLGIEYHLGVDGLGLLMVLLSALLAPFAMLASWEIGPNRNLYFALILFLEAGLFGTFTALNFFHWFIYWELGLIPGRTAAHARGEPVSYLHACRQHGDAAGVPGALRGDRSF